MRDLTPDTLCTFSPDPSEQSDARWSGVDNDEDMEANVLYAVATPGILKLWPWVNQVCHCLQHTTTFLTQTRVRRLSRSLPSYLLRRCYAALQKNGVCSPRLLLKGVLCLTGPPFAYLFLAHALSSWRISACSLDSQQSRMSCNLEPHEQLNSPIIAWSNRGALDGALEELWTWLADMRSSVNAWYSRISRRWR